MGKPVLMVAVHRCTAQINRTRTNCGPMMPDSLPTVRAAIERILINFWDESIDAEQAADAILATLSDPAAQDTLARWLVAQEDGPFEHIGAFFANSYRLRRRTRSEPT